MLETFLFSLWFFLPVGVANMVPVFAAKIKLLKPLDYPLDFYKTFRGKRIFGAHKSFRGLIAGIIFSTMTVLIQQWLVSIFALDKSYTLGTFNSLNPWIFGVLCGAGALLGDAIESFFKRQINVAPGKSWFPFDQIDYILGGIVFTYFYIPLPLSLYLSILVSYFLLHLLISYIGYLLGLKDEPI